MRFRPGRIAALGLALTLALVLQGCESPTLFDPRADDARDIVSLAWILLGICAVIFLVVETLLILTIVRSRRRPDEEVEQVYGHTGLEVIWTVIPAVIVVVLLVLTVRYMMVIQREEGETAVRVTGHQWWWSVEYPGEEPFITANEIHVPVGQSAGFEIESADVIHSFWVPQLGGKVDMIPGRTNTIGYSDMEEGTYLGLCAEYCGGQHARMRFWMVVESPEDYQAWAALQRQDAAEPTTEEGRQGQELFITAGCAGCHTIRGTEAMGVRGPDLTHMGSRISIAAGTLRNIPENMERWLLNPQEPKPKNYMPNLGLTPEQARLLTAYMEELE